MSGRGRDELKGRKGRERFELRDDVIPSRHYEKREIFDRVRVISFARTSAREYARSLVRSLARTLEALFHRSRERASVSRLCKRGGSRPAPAMQRTLIKSSRSCRRVAGRGGEEEEERIGIPLSLWQSLSQIKVRFGARENNLERARAARIPRARFRPSIPPNIYSTSRIYHSTLPSTLRHALAFPRYPAVYPRAVPSARAHAGISRPLWTRTWDNPLESIKGPARGNRDSDAIPMHGALPFFGSFVAAASPRGERHTSRLVIRADK